MYKLLLLSSGTKWKPASYFTAFTYLKQVWVLSLLLFSMSVSVAQPTLVKDINASKITTGVNPQNLVQFKGIVYFSGYDATNGQELWRSDGTPEGTYLVKDITPGAGSSAPSRFINVDGTLYFTANEHTYNLSYLSRSGGYQIWKTDGTLGGTVLVNSIGFGSWDIEEGGPKPVRLAKAGNTLFYTSGNDPYGYNLESTKGLSIDIETNFSEIEEPYFTEVNGFLYFTAGTSNGVGLYKSDGTYEGTSLIKEAEGYPQMAELTNVNGILYFSNNDAANGYEIWKSDGTTAGTTILKNIATGAAGSWPSELKNINGTLYFRAHDGSFNNHRLWKSDGTTAGTVQVAPGKDLNGYGFTDVNGTLFFIRNASAYYELWKSDGTATGTVIVKKFTDLSNYVYPENLINVNGILYFTHSGSGGNELWKSNGTETGTVIVKDIYPGPFPSNPSYLTVVNGTLFFNAYEPVNGGLWKTNSAGTVPILINSTNVTTESASPQYLTPINGALYFSTYNGVSGSGLWKSNGTNAGTTLVKDIYPGVDKHYLLAPANLTDVNSTLFFSASNGTQGIELWKSNGTEAGTILVKDINPDSANSSPTKLTNVNGTLFFIANESELWKSDGTAIGTVFMKKIYPGTDPGYSVVPEDLTNVNGTLFFTADNGLNGRELWKSNGTAVGTVLVKDIKPGAGSSYIENLTVVNGTLFFTADNGTNGGELWKSDGTAAGTTMVKDIVPGYEYSYLEAFTPVNGALYFIKESKELWKSDGTTAGTVLVQTLIANDDYAYIKRLTYANGKFFFLSARFIDDGDNVYADLWIADGTPNGKATKLKSDFIDNFYNLTSLRNINGTIYFTIWDGVHGGELWKSDGTIAGTAMVSDLNPGTDGSNIRWLQNISNTLYFSAFEPKTGEELWKYDTESCTSTINTDVTVQGSTICSGSNGTISIKASQAGVSYQAYLNSTAIGNSMQGNGGDLVLTIPALSLSVGNNVYNIKANGCTVATLTSTATITVSTNCPPVSCTASGSILRELWKNVQGTAVSTIPVNTTPTSSNQLTSFEAPSNIDNSYGQRLRGYICPPVSGNYTFYIAADNNAELWLSTDDDPAKKIKIAHISGDLAWTPARVWNKYPTQKSAMIAFVAGKKYYIEALHKENGNGDNLAVAWVLPNTSAITVIPGSNLSPYVPAGSGKITKELWSNVPGAIISAIPLNTTPTSVGELTSFEAPSNIANSYVQRLRGYLHPQLSGNYTFYIAGDNNCELWLSTDDDPTKKVKIAHISGELAWTPSRVWNRYSTQKSVSIALVAGRKYYVEALHKENGNGDNLAVAWMRPGQPITIIAGTYLSPFNITNSVARMGQEQALQITQVRVYPNPFENKLTLQTAQKGKLQVSVTDNLGRSIYQATRNVETSELEIDLSKAQLKAGVYFVSIRSQQGQTQVIRVVKK